MYTVISDCCRVTLAACRDPLATDPCCVLFWVFFGHVVLLCLSASESRAATSSPPLADGDNTREHTYSRNETMTTVGRGWRGGGSREEGGGREGGRREERRGGGCRVRE